MTVRPSLSGYVLNLIPCPAWICTTGFGLCLAIKMASSGMFHHVVWYVLTCSTDAYCLHHQGDGPLKHRFASNRLNIPKESHLRTHRHENLESHRAQKCWQHFLTNENAGYLLRLCALYVICCVIGSVAIDLCAWHSSSRRHSRKIYTTLVSTRPLLFKLVFHSYRFHSKWIMQKACLKRGGTLSYQLVTVS